MPDPDPTPPADDRRTRRLRCRLAGGYEHASRVPRELADRLLEHLDPVRLDPRRVLEVGAATGYLRRALQQRYRGAQVVSVEDCQRLLRRARGSRRWGRRAQALVCAAAAPLPLAAASVDLLVSNLALLLAPDIAAAVAEWRRVLRPGGLLMVATLGPGSLQELRQAWTAVDAVPHLHRYPDMHDLGDGLVRAGFADVVMDSQRLRVEFDGLRELLSELRILGGGYALPDRRRGLLTPRQLRALERAYAVSAPGERCWASIEAVFAHAWVLEPPVVEVAPPRRRR